jgi:flagellar biosynthesis/type III secretory pathway M-ring protein FliF/YscJ
VNAFLFAAQFGSLTTRDIIADIPRNLEAFIVFGLYALLLFLIWFGSRKSIIERYRSGEWTDADEPKPRQKS